MMSAFTTFNDHPSATRKFLVEEILRNKWGFDGVLISDWAQIEQLVPHGVAKDKEEACRKAIELGIDIDLTSKVYSDYLEKVINEFPELEKKLDEAVLRVLKLKVRMGLFKTLIPNLLSNRSGKNCEKRPKKPPTNRLCC